MPGSPTHLVAILHDVAGVSVGLYQLVLPVECLFGQVLHVRVFHPVDTVPVPQVRGPLLIIVTGVG